MAHATKQEIDSLFRILKTVKGNKVRWQTFEQSFASSGYELISPPSIYAAVVSFNG